MNQDLQSMILVILVHVGNEPKSDHEELVYLLKPALRPHLQISSYRVTWTWCHLVIMAGLLMPISYINH